MYNVFFSGIGMATSEGCSALYELDDRQGGQEACLDADSEVVATAK